MDLEKMTNPELKQLCKDNKIKNYSKYTKDKLIEVLVEAGIKNVPSKTETKAKSKAKVDKVTSEASAPKSPPKPRVESIAKKLERFITLDNYKVRLGELSKNAIDDDIEALIMDDVKSFIKSESVNKDDLARYIDKYGPIKAVALYLKSGKSATLKDLSEESINEKLAYFIYKTDITTYANIIKKFRKYLVKLHTVVEVKVPKAKVVKAGAKPSKSKTFKDDAEASDDEDEDQDDEDDEDDKDEDNDEEEEEEEDEE